MSAPVETLSEGQSASFSRVINLIEVLVPPLFGTGVKGRPSFSETNMKL
jgi:hypothetical protein